MTILVLEEIRALTNITVVTYTKLVYNLECEIIMRTTMGSIKVI